MAVADLPEWIYSRFRADFYHIGDSKDIGNEEADGKAHRHKHDCESRTD